MITIDIKKKPRTKKVFRVNLSWEGQEFKTSRDLNVQEVDKFIDSFKVYLDIHKTTIKNLNVFGTCEYEEVRNISDYIILKLL